MDIRKLLRDILILIADLCLIQGMPYSKVVDLSHSFSNATLYWPGSKTFSLEQTHRGSLGNIEWVSTNNFEAAEHGGTHMDAPAHFSQHGWTLEQIPVERLSGPAVVIDISSKSASNPDAEVTINDINDWETQYGKIPDGAFVFIFSNWSARWPNEEQFFGNDDEDTTNLHYPGMNYAAAAWLMQHRHIYAVGIDTPSPDHGSGTDFAVHTLLCGENIIIMENVNHLDLLPASGATVYAFPMKIKGGSGGPTRIIAYVTAADNEAAGAVRVHPLVHITLVIIAMYQLCIHR